MNKDFPEIDDISKFLRHLRIETQSGGFVALLLPIPRQPGRRIYAELTMDASGRFFASFNSEQTKREISLSIPEILDVISWMKETPTNPDVKESPTHWNMLMFSVASYNSVRAMQKERNLVSDDIPMLKGIPMKFAAPYGISDSNFFRVFDVIKERILEEMPTPEKKREVMDFIYARIADIEDTILGKFTDTSWKDKVASADVSKYNNVALNERQKNLLGAFRARQQNAERPKRYLLAIFLQIGIILADNNVPVDKAVSALKGLRGTFRLLQEEQIPEMSEQKTGMTM